MKELSRRELIIRAGSFAAGAAVAAAGLPIVTDAEAKAKIKKAQYPWPYVKLDPKEVAERAYENWYKGYCCYAVVSGILEPLREKVGEPYTLLPLEAFRFGHGGVIGWGTMCGTLIGAGLATSFTAGTEGEEILNDVIQWYSVTEFPLFKPKKPKAHPKSVTVSNSPLCHVSVGTWMKKEGAPLADPRRKDRCARIAADVAAKTASLLNDWDVGSFEASHGSQSKMFGITAQSNCTDCHGNKVPSPPQAKK